MKLISKGVGESISKDGSQNRDYYHLANDFVHIICNIPLPSEQAEKPLLGSVSDTLRPVTLEQDAHVKLSFSFLKLVTSCSFNASNQF